MRESSMKLLSLAIEKVYNLEQSLHCLITCNETPLDSNRKSHDTKAGPT
jgi:hypothetical protein